MQELIIVTGIIMKQTPIGEYDRRICLLTKERGKISAFVKGSRKPGNKLSSATNPFSFGIFKLYQGKTSYNVIDVDIHNYFEELRIDYISAYYGMYFIEIADFYTRENNDENMMLKLIYQTLKALTKKTIDNRLIKCIFEIKSIVINGEFQGIKESNKYQEATTYAIHFIVESSIEKLYTFTVSEEVLKELELLCTWFCKQVFDKEFKTLEILKSLS